LIAKCHRNRKHFALGLCSSCYNKKRYRENPELFRARSQARRDNGYKPSKEAVRRAILFYRHRLTTLEFDKMFASQKGLCFCGRKFGKTWSELPRVDHDRKHCPGPGPRHCKRCIRGLLCNRCNRVLGFYRKEQHLLPAYLKRYIKRDRPFGL
jgi:Recombination endonuclease VII